MGHRWRIELFAELRATYRDRSYTRFRTRKTGLLLAYLAYYPQHGHRREALIELLWPECEPALGRNNLSKELTALRHLLEPPGQPEPEWLPGGSILIADRNSAQLQSAAFTTDVAEFEAALHAAARARGEAERRQQLAEAIELYRGELLPGYFDGWVLHERQRLGEAYLWVLRQLIESLERAGEVTVALRLAHRAVQADPLGEEYCRDLMRLLAASGQAEAALRHFEELEKRLDQELGGAPEAETRALARELARQLSAAPVTGAPAPPSPLPTPPSAASPLAPLTGTVTLLLVEFVGDGSTDDSPATGRPVEIEGDLALLRPLFQRWGGQELGRAEGAQPVAFGRATDAVAALGGQQLLRERAGCPAGRSVRMALHTGEISPGDALTGSPLLVHATRLLLAARGGQILLSEAAAALLRQDAAAPPLADLGLARLGSRTPPERLFQVVNPGSETPKPPLPGFLTTERLPPSLNRFFGRESEIARLVELVCQPCHRLITLTGPGGSGKTRLALEVARTVERAPLCHELSQRFIGPVSLVELTDPGQIPAQVLAVLHLPHAPHLEPFDQLVAVLSACFTRAAAPTSTADGCAVSEHRGPALLLDNFEHLVSGGAELVQRLLERVPALTCLVTSRQRLQLEGECEFAVAPLPVPVESGEIGYPQSGWTERPAMSRPPDPSTHSAPLSALCACPSVALFVDRAQAARPDFQLTASNAAAVSELCRRLEGIPLAIELAAARASVLTPGQMLGQLAGTTGSGACFDLLVNRARRAPTRHRSLRATLDWSFQLLSPLLQRLLARLSAFRGGWTSESAEAVCGELHLDALAQLRDASLVQVQECAGEMRYRMLEIVREYAREQLAPEEAAALQGRHAEYYLALAEQAEPELEGPEQGVWFARLEQERDNLRAALTWTETEDAGNGTGEPSEPDRRAIGLRMAGALGLFRQVRGPGTEGLGWLERALARSDGGSRVARAWCAKALAAAGRLAWNQADLETARALCEESVAIARELDDHRQLIRSLFTLAWVEVHPGDLPKAMEHQRECQALSQGIGDRSGLAYSLHLRVRVAFADDPVGARPYYEQSLAIFRELGNKRMIAQVANDLAQAGAWWGDDALGWGYQEEALAIYRELGDLRGIVRGLHGLGRIAVSRAELVSAHSLYQEGLGVVRGLADRWHLENLLTSLGVVNGLRGDYEAARRCHEEALAIKRDRGNRMESAANLHFLGEVAMAQGRWTDARAFFEEAHAIDSEHGFRSGLASGARGRAAMKLGHFEEARRIFEADLEVKRELGDQRSVATNLHFLGDLCVHEGDHESARSFVEESLTIRQAIPDRLGVTASLELLAAVAAALGRAERAARLFGAAEALRETIGAPLPPAELADYGRRREILLAALGETGFAAAWNEGRALPMEQAAGLALQGRSS